MTFDLVMQTIVNGLLIGFVFALVAVGLTLIFGMMEIVNFAHGEFLMLAMYSSFWMWSLFAVDPLAIHSDYRGSCWFCWGSLRTRA